MVFIKSCYGLLNGIQVECDWMNKYGCFLLGCIIKLKFGLSGKNYGCVVYECLCGGLDFIKDDENINFQFFQCWQNCFEFVVEVIKLFEQEIGECKGYYFNVIVNIFEEMYECVEFVKEFGMLIVMYDFIIGGFIVNIGFLKWCCKNGMFLYIYCVMYVVIDCYFKYGIYFCVFVKCLCLFGGDQFYIGIVVGKLEGDCQIIFGYIDQLCEFFVFEDCSCGNFFDQDWGFMFGVFVVVFGGIYVWYMFVLVVIFGDDFVLQFGGGIYGYFWGFVVGVVVNCVVFEVCVKVCNVGCEIEKESWDIFMEVGKYSFELVIVFEIWKEIKFEFDIVDKFDVQN